MVKTKKLNKLPSNFNHDYIIKKMNLMKSQNLELDLLFNENQYKFFEVYTNALNNNDLEMVEKMRNIIIANSFMYFLKVISKEAKNSVEQYILLSEEFGGFLKHLDKSLRKFLAKFRSGRVENNKKTFTKFLSFDLKNVIIERRINKSTIKPSYTHLNKADLKPKVEKIKEILQAYIDYEQNEKLFWIFMWRYIFEERLQTIQSRLKNYNNIKIDEDEIKKLVKESSYFLNKIIDIDLEEMKQIAKMGEMTFVSLNVNIKNEKNEEDKKRAMIDFIINENYEQYILSREKLIKLLDEVKKNSIKKYKSIDPQTDLFEQYNKTNVISIIIDKLKENINNENKIYNLNKVVKSLNLSGGEGNTIKAIIRNETKKVMRQYEII